MRETIDNLARGILKKDIPKIEIIPGDLKLDLSKDNTIKVDLEVVSTNGQSIKAACFCDAIRVKPDRLTLAGRRIHMALLVDTFGLAEGTKLKGQVVFITNSGEIIYPYEFEIVEDKNPATIEDEGYFVDNPLKYVVIKKSSQKVSFTDKFPKENGVFMEMLKDMIRSHDESYFAFETYKEAIKRKLNVTHLYESFLEAYPLDGTEEIPKEVLLYFSYDYSLSENESEKLFANIARFYGPGDEIFDSFSTRMSAFSMNQAMQGRINERLSLIYDRMILEGMIDMRAASVVPDILNCQRIEVGDEEVRSLTLSYPKLNQVLKARVYDGVAYVPRYFDDAVFRFYLDPDGPLDPNELEGNALNEINFEAKKLFDKPGVIFRCAEISPDLDMFLAKDALDIEKNGIKDALDKNKAIQALKSNIFKQELRNKLIQALCKSPKDMEWLSILKKKDYNFDTLRALFKGFLDLKRYPDAFKLIIRYGTDIADMEDLRLMTEELSSLLPSGDTTEDITRLSKLLFDHDMAEGVILEHLTKNYNGSIEDMLNILSAALRSNVKLFDLAERIITYELFTGNYADIDNTFKVYLESGDYLDAVIRAYLYVRSYAYFLMDEPVDTGILMDVLEAYLRRVDEPAKLPSLLSITLTSYYADQEEISDLQKGLCQKLIDMLISRGYIFRYTKKLRKKVHIPEEICWKYYIEYKSISGERPKLLLRIVGDEEKYHEGDLRRVYKNIFVYSTVLFTGDELHYLIYEGSLKERPNAEGIIKVTKLHEKSYERIRYINHIMAAIESRDEDGLKEGMLGFLERAGVARRLFDLEGM